MPLASELFLKRKDIVESKFLISVNYSFNAIIVNVVNNSVIGAISKYQLM